MTLLNHTSVNYSSEQRMQFWIWSSAKNKPISCYFSAKERCGTLEVKVLRGHSEASEPSPQPQSIQVGS